MPQQAAGTRMEPAVSVPKATSAIPLATATAEPLDEPPGIILLLLLKGLLGVPKKSLIPEGATANSLRFVFPTICTFRRRAIARHCASREAARLVLATYSEPAVVTTPFMSMRSLTARRNRLLSFLAHLSQLEESATREGAPELHRGQKVCTTGAMF